MTHRQAETAANVVLGAAALGAAYVVLRTPQLRRVVLQLGRTALLGALPAWFSREVRAAWTESERVRGVRAAGDKMSA